MEKRALIAALVAGGFLVLWYALFAPPPPATQPPPPASEVVGTAVVESTAPGEGAGVAETEAAASGEPAPPSEPARAAERGEPGREVVLEGEGWVARLSADGGVIRSLVLREYRDAEGAPLELVGATPPLSFAAQGPWNEEAYAVTEEDGAVLMRWSDGAGNWAEKSVRAGEGTYGLEIAVRAGGGPRAGGVVVSAALPAAQEATGRFGRSGAIVRIGGERERFRPGKLESSERLAGLVEFAGVEDQYFLVVMLPDSAPSAVSVIPSGDNDLLVTAALGASGVSGSLFAGPKQHEVLVGYGRGLETTLSFGLFGFMSVLFLGVLQWIHGVVGNWGVAIIVLTAAIRVPLFPLTHKSTVAMRRMQKLRPKMEAIQARYKERAKKDPKVRAKMNEEVMGLYRQEGVNPMGGCLPTLVQLPILWALYTLFAYAIELRQAPFALWITDLSLKDPTYVLPILMTASMFLQQKLAPQMGDPGQRRMFMMMPIIFGVMFMSFPAGLVLYWLTNNVLTIGQQLITERLLRGENAKA